MAENDEEKTTRRPRRSRSGGAKSEAEAHAGDEQAVAGDAVLAQAVERPDAHEERVSVARQVGRVFGIVLAVGGLAALAAGLIRRV